MKAAGDWWMRLPGGPADARNRCRDPTARRRGIAWIAFTVVAAWLAGCGPGGYARSTAFRDSAGVAIAESDPDAGSLAQWTVSEAPALEIGVVDGDPDYQFYDIRGVARLGDGRIVVANASTAQLRSYSSEGMHERSVGGVGDGPGEYRFMRTFLRLPGDSILVSDAATYRLTEYDADLDLVRSWPSPALGPFTAPPPIARLPDGRWLALTSRTIGEIPGDVVFTGVIVEYTRAGDVDSIAELPGPRSRIEPCGPDGSRMCNYGSRFAATTHVAVSGDRIYAGNGDGFEIRVLDPVGRIVGLWRAAVPARPVTDAELERDRAALLASVSSDEARRRVDAQYARTPVPDVMPAYSNLLIDDVGDLWVETYHTSYDPERRFLVFATDGRLVAVCVLPGGLDVRQIGADFVLGIWKDESGVEFVRSYSLDRSGGDVGA